MHNCYCGNYIFRYVRTSVYNINFKRYVLSPIEYRISNKADSNTKWLSFFVGFTDLRTERILLYSFLYLLFCYAKAQKLLLSQRHSNTRTKLNTCIWLLFLCLEQCLNINNPILQTHKYIWNRSTMYLVIFY